MTTDQIMKDIITKMLKKYGVDYQYVVDNPIIDGEEWYSHYTMTQQEHDKWYEWGVNYIKKKAKHLRAEKEMALLDLCWGLKVDKGA